MNDRQREQARIRQARRRARLKEEGASVTVTLTKQEEAMLQELCRVRRPGRTAYSTNEFFQLLLIRNWQQWQEQKAQLGKCQACGKLKAEGGCGGERQSETFNCWLAVEANELNVECIVLYRNSQKQRGVITETAAQRKEKSPVNPGFFLSAAQ